MSMYMFCVILIHCIVKMSSKGIYCNVSNLHCPPATHLMPIHQSVNMVQWW